jgi:hypothetical protein
MLTPGSGDVGKGLRAIALSILLLAASGCLAPSDAPSASAEDLLPPAAPVPPALLNNSSVDVPEWLVGDAWETTSAGGGAAGERVTFVVTAASRDGYVLSTTSESLAGYDAAFDISYVGKIRASDLAGAQKDKPVAFFSFPMTDGAHWSATWDGLIVNMTATFAPAISTAAGAPGFSIKAMSGDKPYATYDYVPSLRWWSHIDFAAGYGLKVERATRNWTGEITTATAKEIFHSGTEFPLATFNTMPYHVDEKQSYQLLSLAGGAAHYARAIQLIDPNNQPYTTKTAQTGAEPNGGFVFFTEQIPATPGDWKISSPIAHEAGGSFLLTIHELVIVKKPVP